MSEEYAAPRHKALITERDVRDEYARRDGQMAEYLLHTGAIITPAAREFLLDRKVRLVNYPGGGSCGTAKAKFIDENGRGYDKKPEYMTHLKGRLLVPKNHPRIEFRGRLDSLQAKILETQTLACRCADAKLADELQDVLGYVRELLRAEVVDEPPRRNTINAMTLEEIHARSHDPKKYYGMPHLMADRSMGECVVALNSLRTLAREAELAAFRAFYCEETGFVAREDIIEALNRLSSCFYIMMFEHLPKGYDPKPSGI